MPYQLRPGVIKTSICGVWLLLATRSAAAACKQSRQLTLPEALCVDTVIKGLPEEHLKTALRIVTKLPDGEPEQELRRIFDVLVQEGWLLEEQDR